MPQVVAGRFEGAQFAAVRHQHGHHADPPVLERSDQRREPALFQLRDPQPPAFKVTERERQPQRVEDDQLAAVLGQPAQPVAGIRRQEPVPQPRRLRVPERQWVVRGDRLKRRGSVGRQHSRTPQPHAVHRRFPARLARFVDRVLVQQHLDFVEQSVPAHGAVARRQVPVDVAAGDFCRRLGPEPGCRDAVDSNAPAFPTERVEREFAAEVPVQRRGQGLGIGRCHAERRRWHEYQLVAVEPQVGRVRAHPRGVAGRAARGGQRKCAGGNFVVLVPIERLRQPAFQRYRFVRRAPTPREQQLQRRQAQVGKGRSGLLARRHQPGNDQLAVHSASMVSRRPNTGSSTIFMRDFPATNFTRILYWSTSKRPRGGDSSSEASSSSVRAVPK